MKNTQASLGDSLHPSDYQVALSKKTGAPIPIIKCADTVYYHSRYDPEKEGITWAANHATPGVETYIVFGMGFGYHIDALSMMARGAKIIVIESDPRLLMRCLHEKSLEALLSNPSISIHLVTQLPAIASTISLYANEANAKLLIYPPALKILDPSLNSLKEILHQYQHQLTNINQDLSFLHRNFAENILHCDGYAAELNQILKNVPLILVSAGPSLDHTIHTIHEAKRYALVLSVGRATKALLKEGITPDFTMITDGQSFVYRNQLQGLGLEIPLIGLSTCDQNAFLRHQGSRLMVFQKGHPPAEHTASQLGLPLNETGGSVATAALDVAIRWGCNPIILTGQDLALLNGQTHSSAASSRIIKHQEMLTKITGYHGDLVYTTNNLNSYRHWIESRIHREPQLQCINATEGGARIKGTWQLTMKEVLQKHLKPHSLATRMQSIQQLPVWAGEVIAHRVAQETFHLQTMTFTVKFRNQGSE
ncbi:motility associated factor glycosyltransferase family protein [Anoxynatronum sibiricum]|uniref:motility associated factor glycosyltransferase family protein n=1 Tax=Anoxynatronum sibiricum TaxID=210623 RepID=UPI0031B873C1